MLNHMVSFCLVCGKKLTTEEVKYGIENNRRGICSVCHSKEDLHGSGNDIKIK